MAEARYRGRIVLLAVVVLLVFGGIVVRLVLLHLKPAGWVLEPIQEGRTLEWKPVGNRGRIVDCNGEILAMDMAAYHVYVDPKYIAAHGDPDSIGKCLSREFKLSEEEVRGKLADTARQYVVIKKFVPGHKLSRFKRRDYGVEYRPTPDAESIFLRGVGLAEAPVRKYPKGPLMAHVVGFSNAEGIGSAGVEQRMDRFLRGKEGLRVSMKDGRRREIYSARTVDIKPEDGATVMLTLDQQIQYVVEQTIEKTCREFHAKAAWAVVQRVRTGEILAMASYPTYDLNRYGKAPSEWRRNRPISYNYEPGSTMKAAVIAAALDRGVVKESDLIDCENGLWYYGGKALHDSHAEGVVSVADVVKFSSNIGTAKIALKMGNDGLYDVVKSFHFGNRLGLDLPGEEAGILHPPRKWSKISITRIGMGHEIGATALQVVSMMSAIACNGVQIRPWLIKRIVASDGTVLMEGKPEELGRPLGSSAAQRMRALLARVTEEGGTGIKAQVEGYTVAGKTGTAQKIRPVSEGGGYYSKNFISSFVGFLPVENPEIAIVVVVDDPGEYKQDGYKVGYSGGTVCGPAFKKIADFVVRYLRIAPEGNRIYVARPEE